MALIAIPSLFAILTTLLMQRVSDAFAESFWQFPE